jgi:hypothetical protein
MSRKILCRCDICGRFYAAYLVPDQDGKTRNYCYDCWKARFNASPHQANEQDEVSLDSLNLEEGLS